MSKTQFRLKEVKIPRLYVFCLVLTFLGLILINVFREAFYTHLGEFGAGTLQGFTIALIPLLVSLGYQEGKRTRDIQDKQYNLLCAIYSELTEISEYLEGMFPKGIPHKKEKGTHIYLLRPLPRTAWESACISGLIDLEQEKYIKLHHIYSNLANFTYLSNLLTDLSLRPPEVKTQQEINGISDLMREIHSWLLPMINKSREDLQKQVCISAERFTSVKEQIRKQMKQSRKELEPKDSP